MLLLLLVQNIAIINIILLQLLLPKVQNFGIELIFIVYPEKVDKNNTNRGKIPNNNNNSYCYICCCSLPKQAFSFFIIAAISITSYNNKNNYSIIYYCINFKRIFVGILVDIIFFILTNIIIVIIIVTKIIGRKV